MARGFRLSCLSIIQRAGPHVGGVVAVGSPTVLINNLPAARQGDFVAEAPPNTILIGEVTVLMG